VKPALRAASAKVASLGWGEQPLGTAASTTSVAAESSGELGASIDPTSSGA
jgi:hypothetical protein